jgi:hypothetical protein
VSALERVVGRTCGGVPIHADVLVEALGRVYSGDQILEADALADALEDMGLSLTREPDRNYQKPRRTTP